MTNLNETRKRIIVEWLMVVILSGCISGIKQPIDKTKEFTVEPLTLMDSSRNRAIPVAVYAPKSDRRGFVIFSHGYGENKGDNYLHYTYLTEFLAAKGFYVVSIQHELSTFSFQTYPTISSGPKNCRLKMSSLFHHLDKLAKLSNEGRFDLHSRWSE